TAEDRLRCIKRVWIEKLQCGRGCSPRKTMAVTRAWGELDGLQCGRGCSPRKTMDIVRGEALTRSFNVAAVVHRGRRLRLGNTSSARMLQCGRGCSPRKTQRDRQHNAEHQWLQCGRGCSPRKTCPNRARNANCPRFN